MSKFFLYLLFFLTFICFGLFSGMGPIVLGSIMTISSLEGSPIIFFSFCLDSEVILFLFMLFFVSCLVALYSQFYMIHYNLKKYFFLTFLFFVSMIFLVTSLSFVNFLIGWDGLGISSLCLIMFYPNKTSTYNSLVTFFFNRIGDVCLLVIFGFILLDMTFFIFIFENFSILLLLFFLACACTKGAPVPLSSWLPAAMSAPTPISAMVHSSTLVTAGIFILWKLYFFFKFFYIIDFVCLVTVSTFLIGGFLANLDLDTKKIVAFSTMSQISMISFFLGAGFLSLSMFHMFNHALFKTLIFCSCGFLFLVHLGDQSVHSLSGGGFWSSTLNFMFFFSLFMMSGYQFSSSFWTKDMMMESFSDGFSQFFFLVLILGGLFTLYYCYSILKCSYSSRFNLKSTYFISEAFVWKFVGFICFSSVMMCFFLPKISFLSFLPSVGSLTLLFIFLVMISPFFFYSPFNYKLYWLNYDLFFSKNYSFSKFSYPLLKDLESYFLNEQMMFKPFLLNLNFNFKNSLFFSASFTILFLLSFLFFF